MINREQLERTNGRECLLAFKFNYRFNSVCAVLERDEDFLVIVAEFVAFVKEVGDKVRIRTFCGSFMFTHSPSLI